MGVDVCRYGREHTVPFVTEDAAVFDDPILDWDSEAAAFFVEGRFPEHELAGCGGAGQRSRAVGRSSFRPAFFYVGTICRSIGGLMARSYTKSDS